MNGPLRLLDRVQESRASLWDAEILIIGEGEEAVQLLEEPLRRAGYTRLRNARDPLKVLPLSLRSQPDLILLYLQAPSLDSVSLVHLLRSRIPARTYLPILVLAADRGPENRQQTLLAGANDLLTEPFDIAEVLLRVRNLLEGRFLHLQLQTQHQRLEKNLRERTRVMEQAQLDMLQRLIRTEELRDQDTREHTHLVGQNSAILASVLSLPKTQIELIRRAAPLHDLGKVAIPDAILLKPGQLTPEEFEVVERHTTIGASILSGGHSEMIRMAEVIARTHHERWDGTGYPYRLKGEVIPLAARIVGVIDVFDALIHNRPYKKAWPVDQAVAEIEQQKGHHFDPKVADAFLDAVDGGRFLYS